ncbi:GNAT family N-acetyltransferase [Nocardiopsis sp. LOL_012]|uniref:GNAT family N-acetyltransferase n=1 Tax=Nocardiopsis sp. LOL_012 TaxID=3345409 RepID=UPI003A89D3BB
MMNMSAVTTLIRDASRDDAPACAEIYAPYATDTAITFELDPPGAGEIAERITACQREHAWIVLEERGRVVGYAYGAAFRTRAAYRRCCEVSVYLDRDRRGSGHGRALYEALMPRLAARGMTSAIACMTLPNDASLALHRALGFRDVGVMHRVGYKFDTWYDVAWAELDLTPLAPPA